jgi:hypothetical protein
VGCLLHLSRPQKLAPGSMRWISSAMIWAMSTTWASWRMSCRPGPWAVWRQSR